MNFFALLVILCSVIIYTEQNIQTRVANGKTAKRKDFPFMARLVVSKNYEGPSWCGGALISNRHILTAAHCFFKCQECLEDIYIYLGDFNRKEPETHRKMFLVNKKKVTIHNQFHPDFSLYDIAIIELPEAVVFNSYIKAAELPSRKQGSLVGTTVKLAGWGLTEHGTLSDNLLRTKLKIIKDKYCETNKLYRQGYLLCAEARGGKPCKGDSGGPYTIEKTVGSEKTWTVVGIQIWQHHCEYCEPGKSCLPQVASNVFRHLDWISKHTGIKIN